MQLFVSLNKYFATSAAGSIQARTDTATIAVNLSSQSPAPFAVE
jgi:hypothetical protein